MICKICNSEFNTLQGLSKHLFYKHKIEKSDYYLKYINNNCYCKVCGNKTKFLDLKRGFKSICENKECFQHILILVDKSIDEKIKINKSKANSREQLIKKYGYTIAEDIIKSRLVSKYNKTYNIACSKLELEIFNYLKNKFPEIKQQLCLTEAGNIFYYDMFINNIIIEYNGTYWHADPRKYKATDMIKNKTAEECWMKDKFKQNLANKNGYIIFYIWESDYVKNKMHILNEITNKIYAFINN